MKIITAGMGCKSYSYHTNHCNWLNSSTETTAEAIYISLKIIFRLMNDFLSNWLKHSALRKPTVFARAIKHEIRNKKTSTLKL